MNESTFIRLEEEHSLQDVLETAMDVFAQYKPALMALYSLSCLLKAAYLRTFEKKADNSKTFAVVHDNSSCLTSECHENPRSDRSPPFVLHHKIHGDSQQDMDYLVSKMKSYDQLSKMT